MGLCVGIMYWNDLLECIRVMHWNNVLQWSRILNVVIGQLKAESSPVGKQSSYSREQLFEMISGARSRGRALTRNWVTSSCDVAHSGRENLHQFLPILLWRHALSSSIMTLWWIIINANNDDTVRVFQLCHNFT